MKIYRFQDYINLEVESNGRHRYDKYFNNEYFRIDNTLVSSNKAKYCVRLEIVEQFPHEISKDSITRVENFKKLFQFEYVIEGLGERNTTIYFKDHFFSRIYTTAVGVFIQAHVLEPVLYLSFLKQSVFFIHSAGVSKDGKAYIFPAYGGTGKTTTSMSLLTKGYDFLGDDLLIIDPLKNKVFPYPRPLHVFTYNVRNMLGSKIPRYIVAIIYIKNLLRIALERILRTDFLISTRIHADKIIPNLRFSKPALLHSVVFLKKSGNSQTVKLESMEQTMRHAKNIVVSADLNESLFRIIDDSDFKKSITLLELDVASKMLEKCSYFGYLNTRKIELNEVDKYLCNVEAE